MYTAREAADIIGCSVGQIYGLVKRRRIPSFRDGPILRIPKDGFLKYIKDHSAGEIANEGMENENDDARGQQ
jgi:excisionase family DNA binding protein